MDPRNEKFLTLADGRTLAFSIFGSSSAESTIFYFHGFPSSQFEAQLVHYAAVRHNVKIISASRPGFAKSSYDPNRTLLDWPTDVLALADHLRVPRFGVLGVSGGGPYAFACLERIPPERLAAAGIVCGLYPPSLGYSGMMMTTRVLFAVSPWLPGLIALVANYQFGRMKAAEDAAFAKDGTPGTALEERMDSDMKKRPSVDAEFWLSNKDDFREAMLSSVRGVLNSENAGQATAQESTLLGTPWNFELAGLRLEKGKILLWHGSEDVNVPVRMAKEGARLLGDAAELKVYDGEGHISILKHADEIMVELKETMAR